MACRYYVIFSLSSLLFVVFVINLYFILMIIDSSKPSVKKQSFSVRNISKKERIYSKVTDYSSKMSTIEFMQEKIEKGLKVLPARYFKSNPSYVNLFENIFSELKIIRYANNSTIDILKSWPSARQLIPSTAPQLGTIIELIRNLQIIEADNAKVGTQLKLMLTFENGLKAIFKPQWYTRTTKLKGPVYYGKDRHNAEVVAFHLSLLLSLRRVPVSLIKKLKLKEIQKNATPELLSTIYQKNNNTCFYGICHYCSPMESVCGIKDLLEGTIVLWLPPNYKLMKFKHPWQRTYSKNRLTLWEKDMNYCDKVKKSKIYSPRSSRRLLDIIDAAVFDFLMDNGDRHHYEVLDGKFYDPAILLIDNGKSLGNPDVDHIDILAPLYQCCIIHKSTWERLQLLSGGSLSYSLKKLSTHESTMADVSPIITDEHLSAIDRRLLIVFTVIEYCLNKNTYAFDVILN